MMMTKTMTLEKMPKEAVLDGDIIAYKAAFWAETEGIEDIEERITHDIKAWTPAGVSKVYVAVSCRRSDNFRRKIWDPYKRNREDGRKTPDNLPLCLELVTKGCRIEKDELEADDIMGISASGYKAIAVTIDKDLRSVRGWHWNPNKEESPVLVDARQAEYTFHQQWLTGDTTDNIPGIWKCGPVKAAKILDQCPPEHWTDAVMYTYEHSKDAEGVPYTKEYCIQMAQCVRILRNGEYDKVNNKPLLWLP